MAMMKETLVSLFKEEYMCKWDKHFPSISPRWITRRKENGQTLGEYILILLLIAITAIVVLGLFGNILANLFQAVVAAF